VHCSPLGRRQLSRLRRRGKASRAPPRPLLWKCAGPALAPGRKGGLRCPPCRSRPRSVRRNHSPQAEAAESAQGGRHRSRRAQDAALAEEEGAQEGAAQAPPRAGRGPLHAPAHAGHGRVLPRLVRALAVPSALRCWSSPSRGGAGRRRAVAPDRGHVRCPRRSARTSSWRLRSICGGLGAGALAGAQYQNALGTQQLGRGRVGGLASGNAQQGAQGGRWDGGGSFQEAAQGRENVRESTHVWAERSDLLRGNGNTNRGAVEAGQEPAQAGAASTRTGADDESAALAGRREASGSQDPEAGRGQGAEASGCVLPRQDAPLAFVRPVRRIRRVSSY